MNLPLIVFVAVAVGVVLFCVLLGAALYVTGQWREITGEDIEK